METLSESCGEEEVLSLAEGINYKYLLLKHFAVFKILLTRVIITFDVPQYLDLAKV